MKSNENVSILNKLNCSQTLAPPRSQVKELQSILLNNRSYLNSKQQERAARKVTFKNCETVRQSKGTKREIDQRGWKPWAEFRPDDSNKENFAGNYRGNAAARKIASRKARREQARSEQTAEQSKAAIDESKINQLNYIANCQR